MTDKPPAIDFGTLSLEDKDQRPRTGKAQFGSEETSAEQYQGPNRRRYNRRQNPDRRTDFRFEEKSDRRSGKDRRKGTWESIYRS